MDATETVLVCPHCKSTDIGLPALVNPNTLEWVEFSAGINPERKCYNCEEMEDGEHFISVMRCETAEWKTSLA